LLEHLESRELLSATPARPLTQPVFHPTIAEVAPQGSSSPSGRGYSPSQIRHAYGLDQVLFGSVQGDGSGQTIAIIDAYHSPTITQDLHAFDTAFGLPDPPSFRVVAQDGSTHYPQTDPAGRGSLNWETETALDVEWAHAVAPGANILLVEANSAYWSDLGQTAVDFARRQPGVSVVSMSWGAGEFSSETTLDGYFTTVAGHGGVTFVGSSGDDGTPSIYPAASPNVVGIGGTRLSADSAGNYVGESGWSGSGGGVSHYEPLPAYQNGAMSGLWRRGSPDVGFDADPASGVPVLDSYNNGTSAPWLQVGGTSFSAPAWAGILAIADQGRAIAGLDSLDGATQTLPLLYSLSPADFHDVTQGSNGLSAGAGYDLVTGRGTPIGNRLIADMVAATTFGDGSGGGGSGGGGGANTPPVNDAFASATAIFSYI
jgi:subtilase family serine protease